MRFTLDGESFDLTPDVVRARLDGHVPEDIRSYWVEIDSIRWPVKQVISIATGVRDRQRFQSQSSRRWLHNLGFAVGGGGGVTSAPNDKAARASARPNTSPAGPGRKADIVLIGCVKSKRAFAAVAKDLYTSDYFAKMRRYAESSEATWFILSAEHGLVAPNDWLEPYERYLPDTSREYRRAWGATVGEQLDRAAGPLDGKLIEIHAGAAYVESVEPILRSRGAEVRDQLRGLSIGRRLSWYLQQDNTRLPTQSVLDRLRDSSSAISLAEVLASNGDGLKSPGMYSWWVDAAGASDLSRGLANEVEAGLIYVGLAGATRSGGSTSANTLWGRIVTMHLGMKHEFSTLRRSLGSILAEAYEQPAIDEAPLTAWMHAHLRVVPIPVADADILDQLETTLLADLDPPLNLAKVPKTALRQQLSVLRKKYGTAELRA